MTLNLDKHRDSIVGAYRDVMNEKSPTNWALFAYDGQTFDLKLISTGDGGIAEMVDDFNSGKIMYGLCRVKLDDKNMEKIALINWQGEGAPLARKGMCANHVGTVKSFFKGIHVTINARTDEDVEPDVIIASVAKSTSAGGIRMSSSMESDVATPVGACYKRVNPQEEINSKAKNDFWLNEEKEEELRKKDEQLKFHKFSQNEVQLLRRESQDYFSENEDKHNDVFASVSPTIRNTIGEVNGVIKTNGDVFHAAPPSPTPSPVCSSGKNSSLGVTSNGGSSNNDGRKSISPLPTFSNTFVASEKAAALKASLPRKNSTNENLVRQRIKSFDGEQSHNSATTNGSHISNGRNGTGETPEGESLSVSRRKQLFENGRASNTTRSAGRISVSDEIKQLQQESLKINSSPVQAKSPEPISNHRTPSPQNSVDHHRQVVSPASVKLPSPQPQTTPFPFQSKTVTSSQPIKAYNLPFHIGGTVTGKLAQQVNKNNDNNVEKISVGNHYEVEKKRESPQPQPVSIEPPFSFQDTNNRNHVSGNQLKAPLTQSVKPVSPVPAAAFHHTNETSMQHEQVTSTDHRHEITSEMGLCARAMYDYQAADDTEITFDPGEMITNIERIDEGWWEGMGPGGLYGLFPANYVELLN